MLRVRDPFPVVNVLNVLNPGPDLDTRIHLFVRNLQLGPGETAASLVVRLVDSNNQSYDIPAEAVTPLQGTDLSQVTFRLPNGLPEGKCIVEATSRHVFKSGILQFHKRNGYVHLCEGGSQLHGFSSRNSQKLTKHWFSSNGIFFELKSRKLTSRLQHN